MSDNASTPTPITELYNVAGRLGDLHRAVQLAAGTAPWEQTFAVLAADAVLGVPSRDLSQEDRRQALGEVRDSLHRVIDALGLPPDRFPALPQVIAATDRTPRRQVWEAALRDLVGDGLFVRWPPSLQEHIVTVAVDRESDALTKRLGDYYLEVEDALPTWKWDSGSLAAVHTGGYLEPALEPDIDDFLEEARSEVDPVLAHTQVRAVATWVDQQLQTLTERGWDIEHVQDYTQADVAWLYDPKGKHMYLHTPPHAHLAAAHRHFTAEEADAYPRLARLLADIVAATAPSPAQAAFPQAAVAESNDAAAGEVAPATTTAPESAARQR